MDQSFEVQKVSILNSKLRFGIPRIFVKRLLDSLVSASLQSDSQFGGTFICYMRCCMFRRRTGPFFGSAKWFWVPKHSLDPETICALREALNIAKLANSLCATSIHWQGGHTSRSGRSKTSFRNETPVLPPPGKGRLNIDENASQRTSVRSAASLKQTKWAGLGAREPLGETINSCNQVERTII